MALLEVTLPAWQHVWRNGFSSSIATAGLVALQAALEADDPRLIQGSTTSPPPLLCVQDWPIEACDPLAFALWHASEMETVGDIHSLWAEACFEADQRLGEPAACRWFLNWADDTPRDVMRRELLAEVERELAIRAEATP